MTPDIDLASLPSDPDMALGYAELHALWKADEDAFNQGRHVSDAEYLIWVVRVRQNLTPKELAIFDESSKDPSVDEFRAEKAAALARILWNRHGFHVAKSNGELKAAS
jgi:hypothetical protein